MVMLSTFEVRTGSRTELVDITAEIRSAVRTSKVAEGMCLVYVPHTTAAVTINENADPDVARDILTELNKVIPFDDRDYRHSEGNSAAHIKASLVGAGETVLIDAGQLLLGTWQGIYLAEFDGPRTRQLYVKVIAG